MGGFVLAHHWQYSHLEYVPPLGREQPRLSFKDWIDTFKPDVIVGWNNTEGEVRDMGYQIPRELGFASMDVDPDDKRISGVYQNDFMIGQKAVDLVVGMIHRGETGVPRLPLCTLIESEWRDGKTLRKQESLKKLPVTALAR
jgi:LacI family transcriptional regulator